LLAVSCHFFGITLNYLVYCPQANSDLVKLALARPCQLFRHLTDWGWGFQIFFSGFKGLGILQIQAFTFIAYVVYQSMRSATVLDQKNSLFLEAKTQPEGETARK
jgi:hypothetical protein